MKDTLRFILLYLRFIGQWLFFALLIGAPCGAFGGLFYVGVAQATALRARHPWLLFFLPAIGLLIVFFYRRLDLEKVGTDSVISAVRDGGKLPLKLLPAIFFATILTHLGGGSAGREGAALQLGGVIGNRIGKIWFEHDENMLRTMTMMGMAAFFTALFGTPLTSVIFVVTFVNVGQIYTAAIFPSMIASLIAYMVARLIGMRPFAFSLTCPAMDPVVMLRVIVLAVLCGLVSTLFVKTLHFTEELYRKYIPNPYLRVVLGGVLIIVLTLLVGNQDYNGAGSGVIARAVEDGDASPYAFLLKILFTALTLEAGYKGGEIVPTFFIGAVFGCFAGPVLGLPAEFGAAIGLVALFAGATNSILASAFLAAEAFGGGGILYFGVACIVAFIASGYDSLYGSQKIIASKLRGRRVDIQPSSHPHENSIALLERLEQERRARMEKEREAQRTGAAPETDAAVKTGGMRGKDEGSPEERKKP